MEINRIDICNLNSLKGVFHIDFMSGQLKGQDIFAITGATGSGKSTILDAITLALYNRVPRLDGKKGAGNSKSEDPYERLAPDDTRNTLSRGEKKGYAKVVFEVSGQKYRAEWLCELRRVTFDGTHSLYRLRSENDVEKAELMVSGRLVHEFDGKGAPISKTVSKEIVDLVGLGYDQFCKACILAQNSFANFLKANDYEKTAILEKITGTSIYGRIAEVIVDGYTEATGAKKEIEDQIGGQRKLLVEDKDELDRLRAEKSGLVTERDKLNNEIRKLERGIAWWIEFDSLTKKKVGAEAKKKEAEENERKLIPEQKRLERYDKLRTGLKLLGEEADARRVFDNADGNLTAARKRLKDNREMIDSRNKEKEKAQEDLKARKADLDQVDRIRLVKENVSLVRSEYRHLNDSVERLRKAASVYAPEAGYDRLGKTALIETIARLTDSLEPEMTYEMEKTLVEKARKELMVCRNADDLHPLLEQVLDFEHQDRDDQKLIDSETPLQKELEVDVQKLRSHLQTLENQDFTYKRSLLVEGEPCELCGARHHPFAAAAVFNEAIENGKELLTGKMEKKKEVDEKIETARSSISFRRWQRNALDAQIRDLKATIAADDDFFRTVFAMYAPDRQIRELKATAARLEKKKEELAAAENSLSLIGFRDILRDTGTYLDTLDKYLPDGWRAQWLDDESKYARTVEEDVRKYTESEEEFRQAERRVGEVSTTIETLINLIPGLEEDVKRQEGVLGEKKEFLDKAALALSTWIGDLNARDAAPVSREELEAWTEDTTDWNELRERINEAENERISCSALFDRAREDLLAHQEKEEHPAEERERLEELQSAVIYELKDKPDSVEKRLDTVSGRLATHDAAELAISGYKEELETVNENVNLWQRFYNMLGAGKKSDKDAKEFRKLAQNYTLGLLLNYANIELGKFTKRYLLKKQNDSSLEIMVLDGALGERYASSLSGGETFMVSLALALGLSSISSGTVSIKNLFIDEGVGSLDKDTQEAVVGALNTLRAQGKRICIISHTAALLRDENIYKIHVRRSAEDDKFSIIELD